MKVAGTWIFAAAVSVMNGMAQAPLQLVTNDYPANVFGGETANLRVVFANASGQDFEDAIRAGIYQTTSATAVSVSETTWKRLRVLAGQTVLESARLEFPLVKARTKFLVRWSANTNHLVGTTEVWVHPTNLLAGLKPLLGESTLGVLDPNDELKPLFRRNGVEFVDLGQTVLGEFSGRLAILGPFRSKSQSPESTGNRCKLMATNGVAVLWLRPPDIARDRLQPCYFSVVCGTNAVVVAQSRLVENLQENPESQLQVVELCRRALRPEPATLRESDDQP